MLSKGRSLTFTPLRPRIVASLCHQTSGATPCISTARTAAQFKHAGIFSIYDAGQSDGTYYIVSGRFDDPLKTAHCNVAPLRREALHKNPVVSHGAPFMRGLHEVNVPDVD